MAKSKRKGTLNAALKALLVGAETSALIKIPATFIAELASLPDKEQKILAELSQDQFNELLLQSELAAINAAEAAAGTIQIKTLIKELIEKVDALDRPGPASAERLVHNLPYLSLGNLFKGRDDILAKLTSQLVGDKPVAITQAIEGLGGIGKTRLAIEFGWWAWENKRCGAVFFVSAETPEKLRASLASLAGKKILGLPGQKEDEQIDSVTRWLMGNSRWLMILDNADTEAAACAVEGILPSLANGSVIITSRYTHWGGSVKARQLGLLEPQQAKQFLLERTAAHRIKTDSDEETAEKLAKELGYLPLALEQAAAYIANNECSLAEYIEEWENERQEVLEWYDQRVMKYPVSVAVTWQRTFEQLKPSARTLLRLSAFLAPEMIPADMFREGIEIVNKAAELQCKEMKVKKAGFELKEALAELAAYSMITRQQKGFTVHRIVQEVIRPRIPEADRQSWLEIALKIVNNFAPTDCDDVRTWPVLDVLRPHAELIAQTADHAKITEPTARLMSVLGTYLHYKGLYDQAEPLMRRALKIFEDSLGRDHPNVATQLNNLALLLNDTNRLDKAEPLMRRALKIDEDSFGPDHPDVAIDLSNLASLLKATNCLDKAEPLMRRALKIDEASFGPDHPNVAIRLNNLAQLFGDTNRLDKAEPLMRRALKIDEESFGPDHPKVAIRLNNLAGLLQATNRLDKAEPLMRRGLEIEEKSKGKDHPHVAIQLNNLAQLLQATNRLDKAEPLMRRALKIFEDSLGRDHPNVAAQLNNLAQLLQDTNRLDKAEPLMRRALKIFEDSLGLDHPNTQTVRNNLKYLK